MLKNLLILALIILEPVDLFSAGLISGTKIHTSLYDFSQVKLIEELQPNDQIIAFDFNKSAFCHSKVISVQEKEVHQIVEIILEAAGIQEKIYTTIDDKIYLPRAWEWRNAQNLQVGEFLMRYPLQSIPIKEINILNKCCKIIELEISEHQNFCVGDFEVLTHNYKEEFKYQKHFTQVEADGSIIKTQVIAAAVLVADSSVQNWHGRFECLRQTIPHGSSYPDPNLTRRFQFNKEFICSSDGLNNSGFPNSRLNIQEPFCEMREHFTKWNDHPSNIVSQNYVSPWKGSCFFDSNGNLVNQCTYSTNFGNINASISIGFVQMAPPPRPKTRGEIIYEFVENACFNTRPPNGMKKRENKTYVDDHDQEWKLIKYDGDNAKRWHVWNGCRTYEFDCDGNLTTSPLHIMNFKNSNILDASPAGINRQYSELKYFLQNCEELSPSNFNWYYLDKEFCKYPRPHWKNKGKWLGFIGGGDGPWIDENNNEWTKTSDSGWECRSSNFYLKRNYNNELVKYSNRNTVFDIHYLKNTISEKKGGCYHQYLWLRATNGPYQPNILYGIPSSPTVATEIILENASIDAHEIRTVLLSDLYNQGNIKSFWVFNQPNCVNPTPPGEWNLFDDYGHFLAQANAENTAAVGPYGEVFDLNSVQSSRCIILSKNRTWSSPSGAKLSLISDQKTKQSVLKATTSKNETIAEFDAKTGKLLFVDRLKLHEAFDLPLYFQGQHLLIHEIENYHQKTNCLMAEKFSSPTADASFSNTASGEAFLDENNFIWLKQQEKNTDIWNNSWQVFDACGDAVANFGGGGDLKFATAEFAEKNLAKSALNSANFTRHESIKKMVPPLKYGPFKLIKYLSAIDDERNRWLKFELPNHLKQPSSWRVYEPSGKEMARVFLDGKVLPFGLNPEEEFVEKEVSVVDTRSSDEILATRFENVSKEVITFFENISAPAMVEMLQEFEKNPIFQPLLADETVMIDGIEFPKNKLSPEDLEKYNHDKKIFWEELKNRATKAEDEAQDATKESLEDPATNPFLDPEIKKELKNFAKNFTQYFLSKSFGKLVGKAICKHPLLQMFLLGSPWGPIPPGGPGPNDDSTLIEKILYQVLEKVILFCWNKVGRQILNLGARVYANPFGALAIYLGGSYGVICFLRSLFSDQAIEIDNFIESKFGFWPAKIFKALTGGGNQDSITDHPLLKSKNDQIDSLQEELKQAYKQIDKKDEQIGQKDKQLEQKDQQIQQEKDEKKFLIKSLEQEKDEKAFFKELLSNSLRSGNQLLKPI